MEIEEYLRDHHLDDITDMMNEPDAYAHAAINISLQRLQQNKFNLFYAVITQTRHECRKWDAALLGLQTKIVSNDDAFLDDCYQIKTNCHVRFVDLPAPDVRYKKPFPNNDQIGDFVQIKANVVRIGQPKLFEKKREYICSKCNGEVLIEAEYARSYVFEPPKSCATCKGGMHQKNLKPKAEYCMDYQEIKVQELSSEKNLPASITVTLEHDLVDKCQPGECVTLCGTIERRWKNIIFGKQPEITIAMRCVSLVREKKRRMISGKYQPEHLVCLQAEFEQNVAELGESNVRDALVQSICPEIYGMHLVKLAIALAVCSGGVENTTATASGSSMRGQSHLLLVGDPGLAKSRLLVSAAAFAPRAVHTTGMGTSAAGLTAAAVQENGEWQLEAGALVLADGGICCIDEFNLMRETDRASIHEAMEQQTVSLAKAGMVCKLSTRCAVLAAANPRNMYAMSEAGGADAVNIGIASPLMSRFDLVFILRDERNVDWDDRIATHLLEMAEGMNLEPSTSTASLWSLDKLQSHFAAVRSVYPQMTEEAHLVLGAYYAVCRADLNRDNARTTVRLLDSLARLAQAHARLMFRHEVNVYDAVMVVRLMESTHGFGRILRPFDVIREELPLGPTLEDVEAVYEALNLGGYEPKVPAPILQPIVTPATATPLMSPATAAPVILPVTEQRDVPVVGEDLSDDELDRILTLDEPAPVVSQSQPALPGTQRVESVLAGDSEDEILSMALDDAHEDITERLTQSQRMQVQSTSDSVESPAPQTLVHIPHPSNPSSEANAAPAEGLFRNFAFQKSRMSLRTSDTSSTSGRLTNKENKNIHSTSAPETVKAFKRNRLLVSSDDSSDDEIVTPMKQRSIVDANVRTTAAGSSKVSPKTIGQLNIFMNPKQRQSNLDATETVSNAVVTAIDHHTTKSDKKEDDSAYSTQHMMDASSGHGVAPATATTSADIFAPESDEDLSCLDSLDL